MDDELVEPSCWDACCRPARPADEFTSASATADVGVSNKAIFDLLRYNQSGIVVLIIVGLVIVATWSVFSVVPGFARFDGDPTEVSAVSHIGWWIPIEIIALTVGGLSVFISFQYNRDQKIEASISKVRGWLVFYIVVLAVAIAANLVHLALSSIELSNCTSTLCMSNKGFLIVLLVFLVVLALLEAWAIYRVVTYSTNLKNAFVLSETLDDAVVFSTATEDASRPLLGASLGMPPQRHMQQNVFVPKRIPQRMAGAAPTRSNASGSQQESLSTAKGRGKTRHGFKRK